MIVSAINKKVLEKGGGVDPGNELDLAGKTVTG
jgi:hypothetical protein